MLPQRPGSRSWGLAAGVGRPGGTAQRLEYTVIGDPVNEAARLTAVAEASAGRVVAGEEAVDAAAHDERAHWVRDAGIEL
jgi:class 3 adenylate cyclase